MTLDKRKDPVLPDQGGRMMPTDPQSPEMRDVIRRRAYELYLGRGCKDGHALKDWLDAERQLGGETLQSRLNVPIG